MALAKKKEKKSKLKTVLCVKHLYKSLQIEQSKTSYEDGTSINNNNNNKKRWNFDICS